MELNDIYLDRAEEQMTVWQLEIDSLEKELKELKHRHELNISQRRMN